jgi:predicted MFS family arabinose efflux permease
LGQWVRSSELLASALTGTWPEVAQPSRSRAAFVRQVCGNEAADLLARADAGIRSAGQLCTLAGALVGGVLGDALGARCVLWLAVLAGGAAALLAAFALARSQSPSPGPRSSG